MNYKTTSANCSYCDERTSHEVVGLSEDKQYLKMVCCECQATGLGLIASDYDIEHFLGHLRFQG